MMKNSPFISIVLPTRDRPQFVALSLSFLAKQTFANFEVILVDNFINQSCFSEFKPYQHDNRFKYFTPDEPLPMADNWEFAIAQASGEYVSVISEKYLFREDALDILFDALKSYESDKRPELVTWWHETLTLTSMSEENITGRYAPLNKPTHKKEYSGLEELQRRMSFDELPYSRFVGVKECRGKIYSGCFHRKLIAKVRSQFGRVFQPTMPDITSMTAALSFDPKCLDLGVPLMLVCASPEVSNGFQTLTNSEKFSAFYADVNEHKYSLGELPLAKLKLSLNNLIAYDFLYFQSRSNNQAVKAFTISKKNLLICAYWDLEKIVCWQSQEEKQESYLSWQAYVDTLDTEERMQVKASIRENRFNEPSNREIFFSGGQNVGAIEDTLSASQRAHLNWRENKVFKVKEQDLNFADVAQAMRYFTDYYQVSAQLLGLN